MITKIGEVLGRTWVNVCMLNWPIVVSGKANLHQMHFINFSDIIKTKNFNPLLSLKSSNSLHPSATACTEKPKLELVVPGQCRPLKIFYYFDVDQLSCVKSKMAQCEDFGKNRFASMLECRTKCETTACELGESILLHNGSFDQPFLCQSDEDCPVGYNCRQDRIFRRSVCCGFLDFGSSHILTIFANLQFYYTEPCPLGFHSFTVPFSGRPKTCVSSDTRDECPTDYVCKN